MNKLNQKYIFLGGIILLVLIYLVINPSAIENVEALFEGIHNLIETESP